MYGVEDHDMLHIGDAHAMTDVRVMLESKNRDRYGVEDHTYDVMNHDKYSAADYI